MAKREALRDLQSRLALRMQAVRSEHPQAAWLAVDCGGQGVLFPLQQAGEIFDFGTLVPVPHTRPWVLGVANLRGGLHTVVDLAGFLGLPAAAARDQQRLVAFNPSLGTHCALRVDRLQGLRHAADLTPLADDPDVGSRRPAFAAARYSDASGRLWQEIALAALAVDASFLAIAA
ncbi:MAG: chemotaxis protein CheW [Aquabacterium sp.]